ncbi:MAG: hypothetical protein OJF55_000121 [Rhodanobacteraceae bacterium]|nr:MAG: hypothetical protein OJF55_000121 [Rhodanobacteraceae bacterium]
MRSQGRKPVPDPQTSGIPNLALFFNEAAIRDDRIGKANGC